MTWGLIAYLAVGCLFEWWLEGRPGYKPNYGRVHRVLIGVLFWPPIIAIGVWMGMKDSRAGRL